MPIALRVNLETDREALLPGDLGRANHANTLAQLAKVDLGLSQKIHAQQGIKPVTCSGLLGTTPEGGMARVAPGGAYSVRITGLEPEVAACLKRALFGVAPISWMLSGHHFRVVDVTCDAKRDPWTGETSYEELAAHWLAGSGERLSAGLTLHFATPTAFKSKAMTIPIPMPGLVFGSLLQRWNAFSPVALNEAMREYAEEMIAISRFRMESGVAMHKQNAMRVGAVGDVTYRSMGGDAYWVATMQLLADYALYSGVGVQTMTGMGQVRRVA